MNSNMMKALLTTRTAKAASRVISSSSNLNVFHLRNVHIERRIEDLKIELPTAPLPKANYNIVCVSEDTLYVSGHLPIKSDGMLITGMVGHDYGGLSVEKGYEAARYCGLNIISSLKKQLGDLDRVVQVVKVCSENAKIARSSSHRDQHRFCVTKIFGIVNSHTEFKHQHLVMDGCSDVLMEIFGNPIGFHARSAIGVNTLPLDASVEVEAIVKISRQETQND